MPTNKAQLTLRIFLDGREPFEVSTRLADHNHWDMTRARHKWPTTEEAPVTWLAFMAWSAARRTDMCDLPWEEFLDKCDGVENVTTDDEAEPAAVVPIPSDPGLDLSVS